VDEWSPPLKKVKKNWSHELKRATTTPTTKTKAAKVKTENHSFTQQT